MGKWPQDEKSFGHETTGSKSTSVGDKNKGSYHHKKEKNHKNREVLSKHHHHHKRHSSSSLSVKDKKSKKKSKKQDKKKHRASLSDLSLSKKTKSKSKSKKEVSSDINAIHRHKKKKDKSKKKDKHRDKHKENHAEKEDKREEKKDKHARRKKKQKRATRTSDSPSEEYYSYAKDSLSEVRSRISNRHSAAAATPEPSRVSSPAGNPESDSETTGSNTTRGKESGSSCSSDESEIYLGSNSNTYNRHLDSNAPFQRAPSVAMARMSANPSVGTRQTGVASQQENKKCCAIL